MNKKAEFKLKEGVMDSLNDKKPIKQGNIDTTIESTVFKKKSDGYVLRTINELRRGEEGGVVEHITKEAIKDTRGRPIIKEEDIDGECKVCQGTIRKGERVHCDGRCGRDMDKACYQRQGSHVLHGMELCRWDYWMTKLFWQWFSPSIRRRKKEVQYEKKEVSGKSSNDSFRTGGKIRPEGPEYAGSDRFRLSQAGQREKNQKLHEN
jgi:hypothetical protein